MKTALELLGDDFESKSEILASNTKPIGQVEYSLTFPQLLRLVQRVREEVPRDETIRRVSISGFMMDGHGRLIGRFDSFTVREENWAKPPLRTLSPGWTRDVARRAKANCTGRWICTWKLCYKPASYAKEEPSNTGACEEHARVSGVFPTWSQS